MDENPDFLTGKRIAIVGLGLIGGSLAMALRGHCARLLGIDLDAAILALAKEGQVVDEVSADPATLLPGADIIILAAPVGAILKTINSLPGLCPKAVMVMDMGSTKVEIMRAMDRLPARFDPIGGHPMAGKERLSLANAEPGLFRGAPFALTPLPRTSSRVRNLAIQICQVAGGHPLLLEPDQHDRWVGATSHLPYLVSSALMLSTPEEAAPMVGPGFRSATRLAATPSSMMLDVLRTNPGHIRAALARLRDQLDRMDDLLVQGDFESLGALLTGAREKKERLP
jgi:prephenate dehydrogenase